MSGRTQVSEWWLAFFLGTAICSVACKIWLENRRELMQLVGASPSSSSWSWPGK